MFDFANVKFDITSDSNDNETLNNFVFTLNNSNQINEYTLQPEKITNSILEYNVQIATVIMNVTFFYSIEALISIANKSFELVITKQHKKCYITQLLIL
ncbi:unknown [Clostridium sp. CAG:288]|nr:unknown [Clostridium sp. CAG:288]